MKVKCHCRQWICVCLCFIRASLYNTSLMVVLATATTVVLPLKFAISLSSSTTPKRTKQWKLLLSHLLLFLLCTIAVNVDIFLSIYTNLWICTASTVSMAREYAHKYCETKGRMKRKARVSAMERLDKDSFLVIMHVTTYNSTLICTCATHQGLQAIYILYFAWKMSFLSCCFAHIA